jgi:hypothetical protein
LLGCQFRATASRQHERGEGEPRCVGGADGWRRPLVAPFPRSARIETRAARRRARAARAIRRPCRESRLLPWRCRDELRRGIAGSSKRYVMRLAPGGIGTRRERRGDERPGPPRPSRCHWNDRCGRHRAQCAMTSIVHRRADCRRPRRNVTHGRFAAVASSETAADELHRVEPNSGHATSEDRSVGDIIAPADRTGSRAPRRVRCALRRHRFSSDYKWARRWASHASRERVVIDIITSPAAVRGRHGSSLQDATLISLSGVFPFTSGLLGFISALAAARLVAGCVAAVAYYGVSGFEWMLTWTTRCLLTAYLSRHLAPAVLPSTLLQSRLRRPRAHRSAFHASSISCQLGFFREMSWKLVNDALLA